MLIELLWHMVLSRNTANEAEPQVILFAQFQRIFFSREKVFKKEVIEKVVKSIEFGSISHEKSMDQ